METFVFTATYISLRAWVARGLVVSGLLLWALGTSAWGETVQSLSRSQRAPWVVDGTGALSDATRAELNRLGSEVDRSGLGQLMVVMVATTEGRPPRTFATELFNRWKLGHARRDDGVLLFVALLDRKAEIILGDGVDASADVARSEQLMRERIVPALKEGETEEAVLEGARGLRSLLAEASLNAGMKLSVVVQGGTATGGTAKPPAREARPPAPEPKEFLDDEGMYVDLRTSNASEGEGAPASSPQSPEPAPAAGSATSSGSSTPSSDGAIPTRVTVESNVPLWVWGVVLGFILVLIVANVRRGRMRCESCGSTNVSVSTTTIFAATDSEDGLDQVTVSCRSCGYVDTSTRDASSRRGSRSHRGTHGGGHSSGQGSSGNW